MKKWFKRLAQQVRNQGYKHPWWALLVLSSGWIVSVLLMEQQEEDRAFLLDIITSIGTVAAAMAAFWAANLTRKAQQRQVDREREAQRPSVILTSPIMNIAIETAAGADDDLFGEIKPTGYLFTFEAQNISQYSVSFHEAFFDSDSILDESSEPHRLTLDKLVSPNTTEKIERGEKQFYRVNDVGYVLITFFYGATGALLHTCLWEFRLKEYMKTKHSRAFSGIFTREPIFQSPITRAEFAEQLQNREQLYKDFEASSYR